MDKAELESRTKAFALRVIRFVASLPRNKVTDVLGYQLPVLSLSKGSKPAPLSAPTIAKPTAPSHATTSSTRLVLSLSKYRHCGERVGRD